MGSTLSWILLLAVLSTVDTLTCYRCQHSGPSTDNPCVDDPSQAGTQDEPCTGGQCYSKREVIAATNTLQSIYRGCDKEKKEKNVDDEDINGFLTKVQVCEEDHCNNDNLTYVPPPNPEFSCYSCTYNDGETRECIDSPETQQTVSCSLPNSCYISRIDYTAEDNHTQSLARGCMPKGVRKNGCTVDSEFNTCFTFCQDDKCNKGDGSIPPPEPTPKPDPNKIRCYSCTYSDGQHRGCIDTPKTQPTVSCSLQNSCYISRTDYIIEDKRTQSMARGCQLKGDQKNGCEVGGAYNVCLTFCQSDLCNAADGTNPPPEPTEPPGGGDGSGTGTVVGNTALMMLVSSFVLMKN